MNDEEQRDFDSTLAKIFADPVGQEEELDRLIDAMTDDPEKYRGCISGAEWAELMGLMSQRCRRLEREFVAIQELGRQIGVEQ